MEKPRWEETQKTIKEIEAQRIESAQRENAQLADMMFAEKGYRSEQFEGEPPIQSNDNIDLWRAQTRINDNKISKLLGWE